MGAHQPDWGIALGAPTAAFLKVHLDPYARLVCRLWSTEQLREAKRTIFSVWCGRPNRAALGALADGKKRMRRF